MPSLTRWVLAHKRVVIGFWIAMTVGGVLSAGPATRALEQELSVPDKEGSVTNVEIAKRYGGTGGEAVPLLPVVTLPAGKTVDSPGIRRDLAKVDATLERALPGARIASFASTGDRVFASKDGRTAYALVYPGGAEGADFGGNPDAARRRPTRSPVRGSAASRSTSPASTRWRARAAATRALASCSRRSSAGPARSWCCCSCSPRSSRSSRC
jgi:putative drug exporter of the RND superfamily